MLLLGACDVGSRDSIHKIDFSFLNTILREQNNTPVSTLEKADFTCLRRAMDERI